MIHVVARIRLRPGTVPVFLREFRELAVLVRQEPGCLDYFPAQDVSLQGGQQADPDTVTILEKWAGRKSLESHLRSGHMRGFQDRIGEIVLQTEVTIVEEV